MFNLQSLQTVKSTEGPIFKGVNFVVVEGPEKTKILVQKSKTKITHCKKISKNSIFKKLKIVNFNLLQFSSHFSVQFRESWVADACFWPFTPLRKSPFLRLLRA